MLNDSHRRMTAQLCGALGLTGNVCSQENVDILLASRHSEDVKFMLDFVIKQHESDRLFCSAFRNLAATKARYALVSSKINLPPRNKTVVEQDEELRTEIFATTFCEAVQKTVHLQQVRRRREMGDQEATAVQHKACRFMESSQLKFIGQTTDLDESICQTLDAASKKCTEHFSWMKSAHKMLFCDQHDGFRDYDDATSQNMANIREVVTKLDKKRIIFNESIAKKNTDRVVLELQLETHVTKIFRDGIVLQHLLLPAACGFDVDGWRRLNSQVNKCLSNAWIDVEECFKSLSHNKFGIAHTEHELKTLVKTLEETKHDRDVLAEAVRKRCHTYSRLSAVSFKSRLNRVLAVIHQNASTMYHNNVLQEFDPKAVDQEQPEKDRRGKDILDSLNDLLDSIQQHSDHFGLLSVSTKEHFDATLEFRSSTVFDAVQSLDHSTELFHRALAEMHRSVESIPWENVAIQTFSALFPHFENDWVGLLRNPDRVLQTRCAGDLASSSDILDNLSSFMRKINSDLADGQTALKADNISVKAFAKNVTCLTKKDVFAAVAARSVSQQPSSSSSSSNNSPMSSGSLMDFSSSSVVASTPFNSAACQRKKFL